MQRVTVPHRNGHDTLVLSVDDRLTLDDAALWDAIDATAEAAGWDATRDVDTFGVTVSAGR